MSLVLGAIADDFTGATDLANTLVKEGMRTVQLIGVPDGPVDLGGAEAVVIALKSRTCPVHEAVRDSLAAARWLKSQGASRFFFKYCSTFDSTDDGNIGPVADALMADLETEFAIVCPAFPGTGRTIYKGHLFVGDGLLSESSLATHPLTPMTDPNLMRVLGRQTRAGVGLCEHSVVTAGVASVAKRFDALRESGARYVVCDVLDDQDLRTLGVLAADMPLVTGGSGIALGLPNAYRGLSLIQSASDPTLPAASGPAAVLAGSCSQATLGQVRYVKDKWPSRQLDPKALAADPGIVSDLSQWAVGALGVDPILIYSTGEPDAVRAVQDDLGRAQAGDMIEQAFGHIARTLVDAGVRRLIVAGGETSGAVVQALGVQALRIGPEIDPGVPWTEVIDQQAGATGEGHAEHRAGLALALKSGNFGGGDFFEAALGMLQ